jgi:hypothetical protein
VQNALPLPMKRINKLNVEHLKEYDYEKALYLPDSDDGSRSHAVVHQL